MSRHRRATCRQIRSADPKCSTLHETGAGPNSSTSAVFSLLWLSRSHSRSCFDPPVSIRRAELRLHHDVQGRRNFAPESS
jgi:hypothetical protein